MRWSVQGVRERRHGHKGIRGHRRGQRANDDRRAGQRDASHETYDDEHPLASKPIDDRPSRRGEQRCWKHPSHPDDPDRRCTTVSKCEDSHRHRDRPLPGPRRSE